MTTFGSLFVPERFRAAVSDEAWLTAMLDAERALALASGETAIAEHCDISLFEVAAIVADGRRAGNPVEPLVRALRARAGDAAHRGATSQDILDSAAMLVAKRALKPLRQELAALADGCAALAETHSATAMAGRTLMQQAVPVTFGLVAAGWLVGVLDARDRLEALVLPAQLGGAAGTLDALGVDVLPRYAAELGLAEPTLPWHTNRAPVAALAGALDAVAQACAKIGLDVVLLAQTEIGEVSERDGGPSTAMPHKSNPTRAVLARACAQVAHAQVPLLTGGEHELQRAAGAWQAEWNALSEALMFAGGAAAAARECVDALEIHPERMRANFAGDPDIGSAVALVDRAIQRYKL